MSDGFEIPKDDWKPLRIAPLHFNAFSEDEKNYSLFQHNYEHLISNFNLAGGEAYEFLMRYMQQIKLCHFSLQKTYVFFENALKLDIDKEKGECILQLIVDYNSSSETNYSRVCL
jgi:hypothetical protein